MAKVMIMMITNMPGYEEPGTKLEVDEIRADRWVNNLKIAQYVKHEKTSKETSNFSGKRSSSSS